MRIRAQRDWRRLKGIQPFEKVHHSPWKLSTQRECKPYGNCAAPKIETRSTKSLQSTKISKNRREKTKRDLPLLRGSAIEALAGVRMSLNAVREEFPAACWARHQRVDMIFPNTVESSLAVQRSVGCRHNQYQTYIIHSTQSLLLKCLSSQLISQVSHIWHRCL